MIKHVCPICDKVMPTKHICPNCKSWVKEPYTMDVNYYLNETHPQDEIDCSYHDLNSLGRVMNTSQKAMSETQPVMRQTSAHINPRQVTRTPVPAQQKPAQETKRRSPFFAVKIFIFCMILINVIIPLISWIFIDLPYYIRYGF